MPIWEPLASVVMMPDKVGALQLRSDSLHCGLSSIGYMHQQVYKLVQQFPFSLTQGVIEDRLDELALLPPQKEPIASKIQVLMQMHHPRAELVAALLLLRDSP